MREFVAYYYKNLIREDVYAIRIESAKVKTE
jgi:hypothetical protein